MPESNRALKKVPLFENADDERDFWSREDSTDYVDWRAAKVVRFPNLKASTNDIEG
jgi:hypothetical protein